MCKTLQRKQLQLQQLAVYAPRSDCLLALVPPPPSLTSPSFDDHLDYPISNVCYVVTFSSAE